MANECEEDRFAVKLSEKVRRRSALIKLVTPVRPLSAITSGVFLLLEFKEMDVEINFYAFKELT